MVTDIAKPLAPQKGAIVEVNAGPGLLMHIKPETGLPRPVGKAIVDNLFGHTGDARIPVVGITGDAPVTAPVSAWWHVYLSCPANTRDWRPAAACSWANARCKT